MRLKSKEIKSVIFIALVVIVFIAVAGYFGIGTTRIGFSGYGYRERIDDQRWTASYNMLSGRMKHTIKPKDSQDTLHIDVVTDSGSLSIKVTDTHKNIIFDEENIKTGSFDVNISGKISVIVKADDHKGSFDIKST